MNTREEKKEAARINAKIDRGERLTMKEETFRQMSPYTGAGACHACGGVNMPKPTVILNEAWSNTIAEEPSMN